MAEETGWQWLSIHLLLWFLWPVKKWDYGVGNGNQGNVIFWTPRDAETHLEPGITSTQIAGCYYRKAIWLRWLCFTLCVITRHKTEVCKIYGSGYDYHKETLQGAKDKYKKLCESGYYS